MCLSARVGGTLKNRRPDQIKIDSPEFKFLKHVNNLYRKMHLMEQNKQLKPYFS